jgi:hypothetical protein
MTLIILVLSRLRTDLLAENHLIIQERNKFDTEQKFEEIHVGCLDEQSRNANDSSRKISNIFHTPDLATVIITPPHLVIFDHPDF